jgi:flagellin
MALTVRSNMASLHAARQLTQTQAILSRSLERISSGSRINRSADDPAGLAVASKFNSDNKSLSAAMSNTSQGISLVQTAEGGLEEIYNILTNMRSLAVQAASSTYSTSQRSDINTEFTELFKEVSRIATTVNFNDRYLLRANTTTQLSLQIGILNQSSDSLIVNLENLQSSIGALGLGAVNTKGVSTTALANAAISRLDTALSNVSGARAYLGAVQNRLESALNESTSYSESLSNASSRILDVDYATESAKMTRYQILQQAGIAALTQAKTIPQSIISLLT